MNRQQKEQVIEDLKGKLAENNVGVFTRYSGLKVLEINQIRNDLKKVSADYHVVKNTLFLRAIDGTEIAALKDHIHGPLALAVAKDDIVPVAKLLAGFTKNFPKLEVHVGFADGQVIDSKGIEYAATLPGKEELQAKLLFMMNAPLTNFMNVLRAVHIKLLLTIKAIQQQKEETAG